MDGCRKLEVKGEVLVVEVLRRWEKGALGVTTGGQFDQSAYAFSPCPILRSLTKPLFYSSTEVNSLLLNYVKQPSRHRKVGVKAINSELALDIIEKAMWKPAVRLFLWGEREVKGDLML